MEAGIRNRKDDVVVEAKTARTAGSGLLEVYSTPSMIALMEGCCHESVASYLEEGKGTVGISLDVKHVAATPLGMKVYCESILKEVKGRVLTFEVKAYDEAGLIGEGIHQRCIIDNEKFLRRTQDKLAGSKN